MASAVIRLLRLYKSAISGRTVPLLLVLVSMSGCAGVADYERIVNTRAASSGAFTVVQAVCPEGKKVLGGGFQITGSPGDLNVTQSFPQETTDTDGNPAFAWQVGVTNQASLDLNVTAWATCAR